MIRQNDYIVNYKKKKKMKFLAFTTAKKEIVEGKSTS